MKKAIFIIAGLLFIFTQNAQSSQVTGNATVTDGDTIKINGVRIKLQGIDAPEINQTCSKNNVEYKCGLIAKNYLPELIRNKALCVKSSAKTGMVEV